MLQIKSATAADLDFIIAAQQRMAWETEQLTLPTARLTQGVAAVLNDPTKGEYWVGLWHGKPVSCLLLTSEWSDWRNGWVIWLQSLYVLPEYRQKGIFKAMYRHLQAEVCERNDWHGIRLYVDQRNHSAIGVYEALNMDSAHYKLYEWLPN
jgi:ribosomal protein S18 acetylase RimI-like enzyme